MDITSQLLIATKMEILQLFIEFMLKMIDEVLEESVIAASVPITEKVVNIRKLLQVMDYNVPMTANDIMNKLGIKSKLPFKLPKF